jgi:hypothetical protein
MDSEFEKILDQLKKIKAVSAEETEVDQESKEQSETLVALERTSVGRDQLRAFIERFIRQATAEAARFETDTKLRCHYAWALYGLCVGWLLLLIGIVVAEGCLHAQKMEFISDTVILALTGGATVSIIGLVTIVATSLFPKVVTRPSLDSAMLRAIFGDKPDKQPNDSLKHVKQGAE